jgi:acyl carrier protein
MGRYSGARRGLERRARVREAEVREAFIEALDLASDVDVESLEIGNDPGWDSLGHMALVAEFENRFGITLETDDVVGMTSYATSVEILRRHGAAV